MFEVQVIELFKIKPTELDLLLALGWFRMQQTIFTTDILHFYGQVYNAVWLRADLQNFNPDKKYKTLRNKNDRFKTEIEKAIVTPAHEELFAFYKESVLFDAAPSLHALLYGSSSLNVYNTFMINVYDGTRLIGAGFFDLGETSAAGICSIYHPDYKKYSLGKYMIYEKMLYCKNKNFQYFYPGYFVPGYALFDYKLEIGTAALEYFDTNNKQWLTLFKHSPDVTR